MHGLMYMYMYTYKIMYNTVGLEVISRQPQSTQNGAELRILGLGHTVFFLCFASGQPAKSNEGVREKKEKKKERK